MMKQNQDVEIFIDDTARNAIQGTLHLTTKTGLVQDLTTYRRYPSGCKRLETLEKGQRFRINMEAKGQGLFTKAVL